VSPGTGSGCGCVVVTDVDVERDATTDDEDVVDATEEDELDCIVAGNLLLRSKLTLTNLREVDRVSDRSLFW
jgi:hypothetical protein